MEQGNRRCLCPFIAMADTNTQDREEQRLISIYHLSSSNVQITTDRRQPNNEIYNGHGHGSIKTSYLLHTVKVFHDCSDIYSCWHL